jgi:O-antigen/teichoic acid export membrane protein
MASQIVLVPIYLIYWNVKTYGIWLAIQALISVLSTLDVGHQTFLGYEFLKFGRDNRSELSRFMWSGIVLGIVISLGQIGLIVGFLATGALPYLLGESGIEDAGLIHSAGIVLVLQSITWLICISTTGLMTRALAPFGYYPRMAWWGFIYAIVTALAPLSAVVLGADLLGTGIVAACVAVAYVIPLYFDLFRLLWKEEIYYTKPSWHLGYKNFLSSIALFAKSLFEIVRQQGVRLILSPLSGAAGLAAFSTIRTGANVALQGLNTIMHPLMPDLMRFLHERDQPRSEVGFGTIWVVLIAFMAPGVVILQAIIEPFYLIWTQGKIPFDPTLFAVLSVGVLVYAVVQPAMAVVIGNNLIKPQLTLSALAAVIVAGGTFAMVPFIGILGAGVALLAAELVSSYGYIIHAKRWLGENELVWPRVSFSIAVASVVIAAASMAAMILLPELKWLVLAISLGLLGLNLWRYWQVLPLLATQRAKHIISNLPLVKRIFFV